MPAQRRKAANADSQGPAKRTTRSSSKAIAETNNAAGSKTKRSESIPIEVGEGPISLVIDHETVKAPIACHSYTSRLKHVSESKPPTLIFTHGAGGTLSAPAMVNFCKGYSISNDVLAFQGSANLKARVKGFKACSSHLFVGREELVFGGRSMGARAAVMAGSDLVASKRDQPGVSLILVSYPLQSPKSDIRDQILLDLPSSARVLFIIGDRDAMCPLELLNAARKNMAASSKLVVVRGADHGMHIKPPSKEMEIGERTGRIAAAWTNHELDNHDEILKIDE